MKTVSKTLANRGPVLDTKAFAERRTRFISKLLPDSVAIIVSNPEQVRSNDTVYPYRQSSDVLYLSNFPEPQSLLILTNLNDKPEFIMLVRPRDRARETWTGKRFGKEGAKREFGADQADTIDKFPALLKELLARAENVYYKYGRNQEFDHQFSNEWIDSARPLHNPEDILREMRLVKSKGELDLMRYAANISAEAHCLAMKTCRGGMFEYQIQAEMERLFLMKGARSPAYTTIVAGGSHACTLHYVENSGILKDGELVLIDAGCEYAGYASDVTRTFPINGKFTRAQEEIYQLVLDAQVAVIEAAKPGATLAELHDLATKILRRGLIKYGVLSQEMKTKESEAKAQEKMEHNGKVSTQVVLRDLFMHGTSHWLGLDVHDLMTTGTRSQYLKTIPLKPGMVFTVEPALYFDPTDKRLPHRYRGIGVRIEDDVAITKTGCEVLSRAVPKSIKEIQELMGADKKPRVYRARPARKRPA
jgi:Xaa-Pro aminopeptidase